MDAEGSDVSVEEEEPQQEHVRDGYTTGCTTGTDEECSDFFGEDLGPLVMLSRMDQPQPNDNTLEPFQIARERRRHRRRARASGS